MFIRLRYRYKRPLIESSNQRSVSVLRHVVQVLIGIYARSLDGKLQGQPLGGQLIYPYAFGSHRRPFDFLPDFMPFMGYTDDLSAILLATMMAQAYIDDEVREKARQKLGSIFGRGILAELEEEQVA